MALNLELLHHLITYDTAQQAWSVLIQKTLTIASAALSNETALAEVIRRDQEIGEMDHVLACTAWDLWEAFGHSVERTSQRLIRGWSDPYTAHAVLILDGLSLRELPWLLQGAHQRGFTVGEVTATASELPGTTDEFARALGLSRRSQLNNNGGGLARRSQPTRTDSGDMSWETCAALIDATPNWVFWHHWPDNLLHQLHGAGKGIRTLTAAILEQLTSEPFWSLIERLATGRRLVVTSDHGYAATGDFHDAQGEPHQYLKKTFASGQKPTGRIGPPVALAVQGSRQPHLLTLGRLKWKSHGGYPTLTHGGLSLLEVLSPFVVLTK